MCIRDRGILRGGPTGYFGEAFCGMQGPQTVFQAGARLLRTAQKNAGQRNRQRGHWIFQAAGSGGAGGDGAGPVHSGGTAIPGAVRIAGGQTMLKK